MAIDLNIWLKVLKESKDKLLLFGSEKQPNGAKVLAELLRMIDPLIGAKEKIGIWIHQKTNNQNLSKEIEAAIEIVINYLLQFRKKDAAMNFSSKNVYWKSPEFMKNMRRGAQNLEKIIKRVEEIKSGNFKKGFFSKLFGR